ncbi:hypothetical protein AB0G74_33775 [Streptomyces sp. NPDC020875]|uniref:hypothetical protein n=1 Tax=Streptomyces sp. NPDC020875 TaxID=3154898 RepID=UPI0033E19E4E
MDEQQYREVSDRILNSAATMLASVGYEDLGIPRIAAGAGVPEPVARELFPDRNAVVVTLVGRWLRQDVEIAERILDGPLPERPRQLITLLLDAYAERFRRYPGYHQVWFVGPRMAALKDEARRTDEAIAELAHRVLVREYGMPDDEESRRRVGLAVQVASNLLDLAFREDPAGDPGVLAEAGGMLGRYLFAPDDDRD